MERFLLTTMMLSGLLASTACRGTTDGGDGSDTDDTDPVEDTEDTVVTDVCEVIEAEYAELVEPPSCDEPTDCELLYGQCGVGLGGCYELGDGTTTQAELDALGQDYADAGCTGAVCDCPEAPAVDCVDGTCAFVPPPVETCTWEATSSLPGVTLTPPDDLPCTWSIAEVDDGIDVAWSVTVTDAAQVTFDLRPCAPTDDRSMKFLERLEAVPDTDATGRWCPQCDVGLCPVDDTVCTLVPGTSQRTFTVRPRQWDGPSDFGNPVGDTLPPGPYTLEVVSSGIRPDAGDAPFEVRLSTVVTLVP